MTADQSSYSISYRIFLVAVGIVMVGWGIAYGYANYQGDQCTESVNARLDSIKARVDAAKGTIDQGK